MKEPVKKLDEIECWGPHTVLHMASLKLIDPSTVDPAQITGFSSRHTKRSETIVRSAAICYNYERLDMQCSLARCRLIPFQLEPQV